ncbi:MAG: adenylate/guanylate cyclase domain-containing protein [Candidatus Rokuibacteriota bacterium]
MGSRGYRLSLKLKLGVMTTALVVITVFVVAAFLLRQEQQSLTAQITKRGRTIATYLAASAKNPILTNDDLTLNLLVRDSLKDPDVVYVVMTDDNGKIVAHQDLSLIGKRLERPDGLAPLGGDLVIQPYTHPEHGRLLDFSVPLVFSNVRVGALYVGFSQRAIEEALARVRRQTLLISALMTGLGLAGAIAVSTVLSRPILRLVAGTRAIAAGELDVALAIPSRDEIGTLTESFNQMAQSLREKEMIKRAFTRYVAREVADEILKDPERAALFGERRDVTVLFCDIRGFTGLAERLKPEAVVKLLNEFYTLMVDTTIQHGGILDKFIGDGIMAIFGAPIATRDHALQAVRTALAMQLGVIELSTRRIRAGGEPIEVGIGISAGEVVAGTVGTEERMEYTVLGNSVNLGAHLQDAAKPGQILISERTYHKIAKLIDARSLGPIKVKGKEDHIEVYEVRALAART